MKVNNLLALRGSAHFQVAEKQSKTKKPLTKQQKTRNSSKSPNSLIETAVVDFFGSFSPRDA